MNWKGIFLNMRGSNPPEYEMEGEPFGYEGVESLEYEIKGPLWL